MLSKGEVYGSGSKARGGTDGVKKGLLPDIIKSSMNKKPVARTVLNDDRVKGGLKGE